MARKNKKQLLQLRKLRKTTPNLKKTVEKVSKRKLRNALEKVKTKKTEVLVTSAISHQKEEETVKEDFCSVEGMEAWQAIGVSLSVIRGLKDCGFKEPTPVQAQAIPVTLKSSGDIVGAAETGSGKTLAFGIPILEFILNSRTCETREEGHKETPVKKKKKLKREHDDKIVDLNMVYHYGEEVDMMAAIDKEEEGEVEEDNGKLGKGNVLEKVEDGADGEEDMEERIENSVLSEELDVDKINMDDREVGEGEGDVMPDTGLVMVRDDIPKEEFLKALKKDKHGGKLDKCLPLSVVDSKLEGPVALVLVPTRELAMQIHSHITAVAKYTSIKCCPVIGGMASTKQERLLGQSPAIIVATVGRLWMFMSEGHPYFTNFSHVKFLVLDEADKMVESGHYQDLWNIIDKLNGVQGSKCRRNLVYSATLTISRRICERRNKKYVTSSRQDVMDKLMKEIGLKDDAAIVDLTRSRVTVQSLTEAKVMCTSDDKVVFLYYFLFQFPGRTIIFVNTIKCLQRLRSTLELLRLKPLPLHATMQQRQRLKNLDRFNGDPAGLLVASDVAARGLDFLNVDHVIHYQVPMNTELYVHRSGRTARALKEGLSVILVGPEDLRGYQNIRKTLNKDQNLKDFPVEPTYLSQLRPRVRAAIELQKLSSQGAKKKSRENWLTKAARELDIELDEEDKEKSSQTSKAESAHIAQLKAELATLLRKRILPPSLSHAYPTRFQDHDILTRYSDSNQDLLPGMATTTALAAVKKKS